MIRGSLLLFSVFGCVADNTSEEKFIDENMCSVEDDYLHGLFRLKNAENGRVAEMAIEVQRRGKEIAGVRLSQVGKKTGAVQEVEIVGKEMMESLVSMNQDELEVLVDELAELSEAMREESLPEIDEYAVELRGNTGLERNYNKAEEKVIDQLLTSSVPRALILETAKVAATAKATGSELAELTDKVNDGNREVNSAIGSLLDAVDKTNAQAKKIKIVKNAMRQAARNLQIARHGLPSLTVFGRSTDGRGSTIWLHLTTPDSDGGSWDIWGVDIMSEGNVYSFNPLATTDGGERLIYDKQYFPSKCRSNSGSGY